MKARHDVAMASWYSLRKKCAEVEKGVTPVARSLTFGSTSSPKGTSKGHRSIISKPTWTVVETQKEEPKTSGSPQKPSPTHPLTPSREKLSGTWSRDIASKMAEALDKVKFICVSLHALYFRPHQELLWQGDACEIDFSDATKLFINNTVFDEALKQKLLKIMSELPRLRKVRASTHPVAEGATFSCRWFVCGNCVTATQSAVRFGVIHVRLSSIRQ